MGKWQNYIKVFIPGNVLRAEKEKQVIGFELFQYVKCYDKYVYLYKIK